MNKNIIQKISLIKVFITLLKYLEAIFKYFIHLLYVL
jgi:hypothetical protein